MSTIAPSSPPAAAPSFASNIIVPDDLKRRGWELRRKPGGDYIMRLRDKGLKTEPFALADDAIRAARALEDGDEVPPRQLAEDEASAPTTDGDFRLTSEILISKIHIDPSLQSRAHGTEESVIEEYAEAMRQGAVFPPVRLFHDGELYWLSRGFHRVPAALRAGKEIIACEVFKGGRREALLDSIGSNQAHGLRRTNDDKRHDVALLLEDDEWSKWSNREIARRAGVSHEFVGSVREELSGSRSQMEAVAQRGDKSYTVKTDRIGKAQQAKKEAAPPPPAAAASADVAETPTEHIRRAIDAAVPVEDHPLTQEAQGRATAATATAAPEAEPDPEGWSELPLTINLAIKPGKSAKRGITVSGRAGEGTPIFKTEFTLSDLEPMPRALAGLIADLKAVYAKGAAKVATAKKAAPKGAKKSGK